MADVNDKSKKLEISGDLLHGSRDAQQARVAKGADVKAAQALNKNAHNGSAGGNQDHSLQLVDSDGRGNEIVLAERGKAVSPQRSQLVMKGPLAGLLSNSDHFESGHVSPQEHAGAHEVGAMQRKRPVDSPQHVRDQHGSELPSKHEHANEWHALKSIPPDRLRDLAKAFEAGSRAGQESIKETSDEICRRTGQAYLDTAVDVVKLPFDVVFGGLKGLWTLLEYDRDLIFAPERARDKAGRAGEELGKALVAGIRLSASVAAYGHELKQHGDYGRPFRDISNGLNSWYDGLNPADQMEISARICAGFAVNSASKLAHNLIKPGAFIEFLNEAANSLPKNPAAERRAIEAVRDVVQCFTSSRVAKVALAGGGEAEVAFERRLFKMPDGRELSPGEAAKSLGINKEQFSKLSLREKAQELLKLGLALIDQKVYHIDGCDQPLSEAAMLKELGQTKLLGLTKQQLREMSAKELEKFGVTPIEPIDGSMPRNWRLAGKSFSLKDMDPKLLNVLQDEFPRYSEEFEKGVQFSKTGYPNFKPFSFKDVRLEEGFLNRTQDFIDADRKMWPNVKTAEEREARRKALGLTWHHMEDGKTLLLVPSKLHDRIAHTGGVAVSKVIGGK